MWSRNGEQCFPVGRGYHPPWETAHKTASEGPEGAPRGHVPRSLVPKGQIPWAGVSKSCSSDAVYRRMGAITHVDRATPALEPFLQFQSGKQCLQFKELDLVVHIYMSYFLKQSILLCYDTSQGTKRVNLVSMFIHLPHLLIPLWCLWQRDGRSFLGSSTCSIKPGTHLPLESGMSFRIRGEILNLHLVPQKPLRQFLPGCDHRHTPGHPCIAQASHTAPTPATC